VRDGLLSLGEGNALFSSEKHAMIDWREIERRLTDAVGPRWRPVAVAFRAAPPVGVRRFDGRQPSGCSFWRLAADG